MSQLPLVFELLVDEGFDEAVAQKIADSGYSLRGLASADVTTLTTEAGVKAGVASSAIAAAKHVLDQHSKNSESSSPSPKSDGLASLVDALVPMSQRPFDAALAALIANPSDFAAAERVSVLSRDMPIIAVEGSTIDAGISVECFASKSSGRTAWDAKRFRGKSLKTVAQLSDAVVLVDPETQEPLDVYSDTSGNHAEDSEGNDWGPILSGTGSGRAAMYAWALKAHGDLLPRGVNRGDAIEQLSLPELPKRWRNLKDAFDALSPVEQAAAQAIMQRRVGGTKSIEPATMPVFDAVRDGKVLDHAQRGSVVRWDNVRMRKMLFEVCRSSDFDTFCVDYFPAVAARFSSGMDVMSKQTLLLTYSNLDLIAAKLEEFNKARYWAAISKLGYQA